MVRIVCARPVGGYRGSTRGARDGLSDAVCLYPSIGRMDISTDKSMAYTYGEGGQKDKERIVVLAV